MDKIKIAIVEDETLVRKALLLMLDTEMGMEVVHEGSDGKQFVSALDQKMIYPDIVLMDVMLPGMDGIEVTREVSQRHPNIRIIALSSYNNPTFISNMIEHGAASYLLKSTSPIELLQTINNVYNLGYHYTADVVQLIRSNINQGVMNSQRDTFIDQFNEREINVIKLICEQKSTKEIAESLFLSERTIEGYRNQILLKTESKNIAGVVLYAVKSKIFEIR